MKKAFIFAILIVSALCLTVGLTACSSNVTTDKLIRRNWSETDTETFTYEIFENDNKAGTLVQSVKPLGNREGYELNFEQTMINGDKWTATVKFSSVGSASSFPPLESVRTMLINGRQLTQKLVYSNSGVTFFTSDTDSIPADTTGQTFDISAPYYDNMQFYTILRGAAFNNKFNLSFNTFVPNENQIVKLACNLGAAESQDYTLGGEAKAVNCQHVKIFRNQQITGQPINAYYSTEDINVGGKTVKQALIKFIEDNYIYKLIDITVA